MLRCILTAVLALVLGAAPNSARAEPWWVVWEDGWPEEQGWTRVTSDPPPERWLADGSLFIDSRAANGMYEAYGQSRPGQMSLGQDEMFLMSWSVLVHEVIGPGSDPGILISSDDQWEVSFALRTNRISSTYEPGHWAEFTPYQFHDFMFQSSDVRTYSLFIDGDLALQGNFFESLFYAPGAGWGDNATGRSLSEWARVEVGIVPTSSGSACLLLGICLFRWLSGSATGRGRINR